MKSELKKNLSLLELSDLAKIIEEQEKDIKLVDLATMEFVGNATNLFIIGSTGAGKTYLSCALGIEDCKQTYRVLYIRMPDLMRNFETCRDVG